MSLKSTNHFSKNWQNFWNFWHERIIRSYRKSEKSVGEILVTKVGDIAGWHYCSWYILYVTYKNHARKFVTDYLHDFHDNNDFHSIWIHGLQNVYWVQTTVSTLFRLEFWIKMLGFLLYSRFTCHSGEELQNGQKLLWQKWIFGSFWSPLFTRLWHFNPGSISIGKQWA